MGSPFLTIFRKSTKVVVRVNFGAERLIQFHGSGRAAVDKIDGSTGASLKIVFPLVIHVHIYIVFGFGEG